MTGSGVRTARGGIRLEPGRLLRTWAIFRASVYGSDPRSGAGFLLPVGSLITIVAVLLESDELVFTLAGDTRLLTFRGMWLSRNDTEITTLEVIG